MAQKKIKILMVGLLPLDLNELKGGVVAVIRNLFFGFSKFDDVEIVHVSFNEEIDIPITKQFSSNIKIHYLPFRIKIKLLDYFFNRKALNEIIRREQPDLIHIQEITPHLLRFISYPKSKIVVTQHGIMQAEFRTAIGWRNKLKTLFKGSIERYVFPLFNNIIFISNYNKKLFPNPDVFSQNIFNPINPIFFEHTHFNREPNTLIYVAVINKNKNLKLVLDALAKLNQQGVVYKLHVVGGYKDPVYERDIMSLVAQNKVAGQLVFHGWQTQEQLLKLFETCSIFILPSQQEVLPVSVGEAMAQGRVVVASDVGGVSEMFTDKVAGFLFPNNDLNGLCEVLKLLYNNTQLVDNVSRVAAKEAIEKFYPELICNQTLSFYKKVLERAS